VLVRGGPQVVTTLILALEFVDSGQPVEKVAAESLAGGRAAATQASAGTSTVAARARRRRKRSRSRPGSLGQARSHILRPHGGILTARSSGGHARVTTVRSAPRVGPRDAAEARLPRRDLFL
jgi:hypothetical protein